MIDCSVPYKSSFKHIFQRAIWGNCRKMIISATIWSTSSASLDLQGSIVFLYLRPYLGVHWNAANSEKGLVSRDDLSFRFRVKSFYKPNSFGRFRCGNLLPPGENALEMWKSGEQLRKYISICMTLWWMMKPEWHKNANTQLSTAKNTRCIKNLLAVCWVISH